MPSEKLKSESQVITLLANATGSLFFKDRTYGL